MIKNILLIVLGVVIGFLGFKVQDSGFMNKKLVETVWSPTPKPLPLLKYNIESLSKRSYQSEIIIGEQIRETKDYVVNKFHFDSDGKQVSGLIHKPVGEGPFPVIVQFRGYVPVEDYYPGYGTAHSAEEYVQAGFMSIAPDFLGYGESASPSGDVWEARFETYSTALNLMAAVSSWKLVDSSRIGIWGHSNGGQIALTLLEITGRSFPTVLWAPQSLPFPYSVLYYMDENGDGDKDLRQSLAKFEEDYDYKMFDPMGYLDRVNAPMQLHQGTADESIPVKFADQLFNKLNKLEKDLTYYNYSGADHNFLPINNWNTVIERDIEFFRNFLSSRPARFPLL